MDELDDDYYGCEPVGSCEECGTNLYPDDDPELCDQCFWYRTQWQKGGVALNG